MQHHPSRDGQTADHEELRAALHQAADTVADYLSNLGQQPIFPAHPQAPHGALLPEHGRDLASVFEVTSSWAVANAVHVGHPGYVGHMDSGVNPAAILGDFLASALNQNLLAFELAPGATLLEKKLLQLFAEEAGLPATAGGVLTTGGTTANLTALLLARDAKRPSATRRGLADSPPLCVLASADVHYSIAKACAVLGLGSEHVIAVATTGPARRLDPADLPRAMDTARARGLEPAAVVATAGTTSCGAIDPLTAIADFCAAENLWLHVDAAHGGALLLHRQEKRRLQGIHRADSITLDPHKWLYAPKSAGILLVRHSQQLKTAHYAAPYLDRFSDHGEALPVSQGRRALDGSRRFDALKVWMLLCHYGRSGIESLLSSRLQLSQDLHQALLDHPFFAPCHQPDLNVQVFQPRDSAQIAHIAAAHRRLEAGGRFWSSYTRLDGQPCHRMVLLNATTQMADLEQLLRHLQAAHLTPANSTRLPPYLCPKGRSVASRGLLHSSPSHRPKGGRQVALGDQPNSTAPSSDP